MIKRRNIKKILTIIIVALITIMYLQLLSNTKAASTATVTLKSNATNSSGQTIVGAGETFTINVNAQSSDGINMFYGILSYDTSRLQLVTRRAPTGWIDQSDTSQNEILVFNNNASTTQEVLVYTLTFRVLKEVTVGKNANVTISNIGIDTFLDTEDPTESRVDVGTRTFSITTGTGVTPTTPEDDPTIDSDHQVEIDYDNLTISAIQPRTTLANFRKLIQTNASSMVVQTAAGATVSESSYVVTGMNAIFDSTVTYTLIVKGDTDADGDAGQYDMANINAHRLGNRLITNQILFKAGDIDKSNELDQWDMSAINAYRVGQRTVL